MSANVGTTIGVISDTHGLLRPEVLPALAGVDSILHTGDIGDARILDALRTIAPVTAIRGNIDTSGACASLPATEAVEVAGRLFYLIHSVRDLDLNPEVAGIAAVISGHTHRPDIRTTRGVLYLNPGSAGPRRFDLTPSVARIVIASFNGPMVPEIVRLT